MAKKTLYTVKAVDEAIDQLIDMGYEIVIIPGSLIDSYICISPTPSMYNYEFRENAINEWSSAYTVRRSSKLSERMLKDIKAAGYEPPTLAQTISKALLPGV